MNYALYGGIAFAIIVIIILIFAFSGTTKTDTKWACVGDITVPIRRLANGDIQCMSENGRDCYWSVNNEGCKASLLAPPSTTFTCGDQHKSVWGVTGYDDPTHWCAKGKTLLN